MNQFWDSIIEIMLVKDPKLLTAIKDKNPDLIENFEANNTYDWFLASD
jgi:hypothetical protein